MCVVCTHPKRAELDVELASNGPTRTIADRFGIPRTTLRRYDEDHRQKKAVLKQAFGEGSPAPDLIVDAHRRITRIMRKAMADGSLDGQRVALLALKERREYLAYEKPPVQRTKDETPKDDLAGLPAAEQRERLLEVKHRVDERLGLLDGDTAETH